MPKLSKKGNVNVNAAVFNYTFCSSFKEYAEFQYRRRHRQRRRGDMSSLRSNTPDPDDPGDNTSGTQDSLTKCPLRSKQCGLSFVICRNLVCFLIAT